MTIITVFYRNLSVMVRLLQSFLSHFTASCMGMESPCVDQQCDPMQEMSSKVEFAVNMTCGSCEKAVRESLHGIEGIYSVDIDIAQLSVVVSTRQPSSIIQDALETTGMLAVLRGQGGTAHIGAAVAILREQGIIKGLVRFTQVEENRCVVDGSFTGLSPGTHGLHIHELGDLSDGWRSTGDCYNPHGGSHRRRLEPNRHVGDLGNIVADDTGASNIRFVDDLVKVWDIIGRSVVVHEYPDDGRSEGHGGGGGGVACGIVARSSGLFENKKMVCTCSGQTIWEERENARQMQTNP